MRHFPKERLHVAVRQKGNEPSAPRFTNRRPNMRHPAPRQQGIARLKARLFVPNLDDELSFQGLEPFVLVVMPVPDWPPPAVEGVLEDEETAAVVRHDFESKRADAKPRGSPKRAGNARRRRYSLCHIPLLCMRESISKSFACDYSIRGGTRWIGP